MASLAWSGIRKVNGRSTETVTGGGPADSVPSNTALAAAASVPA